MKTLRLAFALVLTVPALAPLADATARKPFLLCAMGPSLAQFDVTPSPSSPSVTAPSGVVLITAIQTIEWIIRESTGFDYWAYVAPDGDTITYSRTLDGRTWQLLATNRRGERAQPFLRAQPEVCLTRGAWSRPHNKLAFTGGGSRDSYTFIYVADATGRDVQRVPARDVSSRVMYPSWMPDGRSVVVVDFGAPAGSTLYRIDVATGTSEALTTPAEFLVGMPSVSPDGELIAFAGQRNRGAAFDVKNNQIWLLPMGGRPREVSAGQGRQPDWSPDGRRLAFTSNRGDSAGRLAVFIVDRNGENLTQLTDYALNAEHPVWSPDGTWLVFTAKSAERSGVAGIACITVPRASK